MSLNKIFNTSISGLSAARVGMSVTSHNISNVNTEGYTRQRVGFTAAYPMKYSDAGYIGSGVRVNNIERIKDMYLEDQIRNENSKSEMLQIKSEALATVEAIFTEPSETGINQTMTDMFNAWDQLATDPSNKAYQTIAIEKTMTFTSQVNDSAMKLDSLKNSVQSMKNDSTMQLDQLVQQLDGINSKIAQTLPNDGAPNDLLDERDRLVNEIGTYMNVTATYNADRTVTLNANLTDGTTPELTSPGSTPVATIVDLSKDGKLQGYNDALTEITNFSTQLNTLTKTMADEMNTVHSQSGGGNLFTYTPGSEAKTLTLMSDIQDGTRRLNVGNPLVAGDGSIAKQMGKLRDKQMFGTATSEGFYKQMVVNLGITKNTIDQGIKNQDLLLDQLQTKRESISGVSLDEETMNLVTFQNAYDANAKVIQVVTEMFDTLLSIAR